MRALIASSLFALTLAACGGPDPAAACENYLNAVDTCFGEAGDDDVPVDTSFCAAYDNLSGSAAAEAEDLLNCYADTISAADCSDSETAFDAYAGLISECT